MLRLCLAAYEEALYERAHQQMLADGVLVSMPAPPLLPGETAEDDSEPVELPGEAPLRDHSGRPALMPAVYVDTSALVKRYVGEVGTIWVRRLLARPVRQAIYTALLAQTEVLSALQRKVRDGTLAVAEAQRLARRVQRHCAHRYRLVAITPARVTQANALVQAHPLRAYDALHLACALAVRDALQPYGLPAPLFITADNVLLAAARAEGFVIDNPLQHP